MGDVRFKIGQLHAYLKCNPVKYLANLTNDKRLDLPNLIRLNGYISINEAGGDAKK